MKEESQTVWLMGESGRFNKARELGDPMDDGKFSLIG